MRPPSGTMVYWRFKSHVPGAWSFGYVSYAGGHDLIRLGSFNGDTMGGSVVSISEIEWRPYT